MTKIRYAENADRDFWFSLDKHLPLKEFERKIKDRQCYIALKDGNAAGLLRYNLFWDSIPFCNMLYIDPQYRGMGCGKQLMEHWEEDMRSQGSHAVMTSSRSDETAQHFFRRLGYKDCGALIINDTVYKQPAEIMFIKAI